MNSFGKTGIVTIVFIATLAGQNFKEYRCYFQYSPISTSSYWTIFKYNRH